MMSLIVSGPDVYFSSSLLRVEYTRVLEHTDTMRQFEFLKWTFSIITLKPVDLSIIQKPFTGNMRTRHCEGQLYRRDFDSMRSFQDNIF